MAVQSKKGDPLWYGLSIVELLFMCVGVVLAIVALATPYWTFMKTTYPEVYTEYYGLFIDCKEYGYQVAQCTAFGAMPTYFVVAQAFGILGTVSFILSSVAAFVAFCSTQFERGRRVMITLMVLLCLTFLFLFICVFSYGTNAYYDQTGAWSGQNLSWSFGLMCAADGLVFLCALYQSLFLLKEHLDKYGVGL